MVVYPPKKMLNRPNFTRELPPVSSKTKNKFKSIRIRHFNEVEFVYLPLGLTQGEFKMIDGMGR